MTKFNIIYKSDWLSASLISSSYNSDHRAKDYNLWPSVSFPIKSAYRYQAGKFDNIIDTNSILFEANNTEFSVYKFSEFQQDITLTFQFHELSFEPLSRLIQQKNRKIEVFRRTPQIEYLVRLFLRACAQNERLLADQLIVELLFNELIDPITQDVGVQKIIPWINIKMDYAKEFIHHKSSSDISLKDIAASCYISPFHFSRVFKKKTGYSPYEYLMHVRIVKARQMLKNKFSVTSTAFEVGYNSVQNFSFAFKKIVGVSPLQYKKSNISKL